jgi:hypothetical protein
LMVTGNGVGSSVGGGFVSADLMLAITWSFDGGWFWIPSCYGSDWGWTDLRIG